MKAVKNAPTAVSSVHSSHSSPDNARPPAQIGFKQIHNSNELKHSRKRRAKPHHQSIHIHIAAAGEIRGNPPPLPLKISCHDPIIYFDGSKMTGWFLLLFEKYCWDRSMRRWPIRTVIRKFSTFPFGQPGMWLWICRGRAGARGGVGLPDG